MLSIIICSSKEDISQVLRKNIEATVGITHEVIVINNSQRHYSMFSAYNEGVRRAKFDNLCFCHQDVRFHSGGWGKKIAAHLEDRDTGLIGLAGSFYLLDIPAPWFKAKPYFKNLIQSYRDSKRLANKYELQKDEDVICVDGFFFCSRKDVFQKVRFDELYGGFHFYDLDISMQIHESGYRIKVISDITVKHFSTGTMKKRWIHAAYMFYDKWKDHLPATIYPEIKIETQVRIKAFRDLLYLHFVNLVPLKEQTMKSGWRALRLNIITAMLLVPVKLLLNAVKSLFHIMH
ncbi:MAG: glycosyltransferase family protein [Dysgonamonadaceae bacterium]|jgi:GT2 family glycosyltransferase|nr:glycosyltransferase family protein [Dysgonamonadaceae bacterium]